MVSTRFLGLVSTVLLVVGALLVGQAFHLSLVTGQISYGSPAFVLNLVVGTVLIALGYRARRPVAEAYDLTSDDSDGRGGADSTDAKPAEGSPNVDADAEFDPAMSPLGDGAPGDAERDRAGGAERAGRAEESDRAGGVERAEGTDRAEGVEQDERDGADPDGS